jgi:hypothetical protein
METSRLSENRSSNDGPSSRPSQRLARSGEWAGERTVVGQYLRYALFLVVMVIALWVGCKIVFLITHWN